MGSAAHPPTHLIHAAIARAVENTKRNGGVIPVVAESRRLALTYPESGLSEEAIRDEFRQRAAELYLPTDERPCPEARGFDFVGDNG